MILSRNSSCSQASLVTFLRAIVFLPKFKKNDINLIQQNNKTVSETAFRKTILIFYRLTCNSCLVISPFYSSFYDMCKYDMSISTCSCEMDKQEMWRKLRGHKHIYLYCLNFYLKLVFHQLTKQFCKYFLLPACPVNETILFCHIILECWMNL